MKDPQKLTGTTGGLFRLLETQKRNPNARDDLACIKEFINENTGFRFAYATIDKGVLILRALAK